jgi:hypothetical protein
MKFFDNANLANVVVGVVLDFLQKKKTFSAYEVVLAIRDLYPSYCVMNSAVRPKVHDLFYKGFFTGYDRYDTGTFIQYRPSVSFKPASVIALVTLNSKSGNVRIPVAITKQLSLSPGDKVNVTLNGVRKPFTVDVYGNVKITTAKNKNYAVVVVNNGVELNVV